MYPSLSYVPRLSHFAIKQYQKGGGHVPHCITLSHTSLHTLRISDHLTQRVNFPFYERYRRNAKHSTAWPWHDEEFRNFKVEPCFWKTCTHRPSATAAITLHMHSRVHHSPGLYVLHVKSARRKLDSVKKFFEKRIKRRTRESQKKKKKKEERRTARKALLLPNYIRIFICQLVTVRAWEKFFNLYFRIFYPVRLLFVFTGRYSQRRIHLFAINVYIFLLTRGRAAAPPTVRFFSLENTTKKGHTTKETRSQPALLRSSLASRRSYQTERWAWIMFQLLMRRYLTSQKIAP